MLSQDPCLGGVMDFQSLGEVEGHFGFEGLVERSDAVGVEVVHHQHHCLGVGVVEGEQPLDLVGPVDLGALRLGIDVTPAGEGFDPYEDRAGSRLGRTRCRGEGRARWVRQSRGSGRGRGRVVGRASRPCTPRAASGRTSDGRPRERLPSWPRIRRWPSARWSSTSSDEDEV